jgi:hypothetical protein
MKMANYIYSIITSRKMVMWSWGFHNPVALPNDEGLIFRVNGFKHQGFVKVIYNEGKDLFMVILLDNQNNESQRLEDVYFDMLVDVIDEAVERTTDYDERVKSFYNN